MAQGSEQRGAEVVVKVWTFEVRGGSPFVLGFTKESGVLSPPLEHGHRWTIWKMVGTEEMAQAVESTVIEQGCTVERYTEEQAPEQTAERRERLGKGD